jgi:hypothetical protein
MMRGVIHRVSGGLAALSAAALVAFATDSSTQPTSWAVPGAIAILVASAVAWLLTRMAEDEATTLRVGARQSGDGEQNVLTHEGGGDIVQGSQHNYYRPLDGDSEEARRGAALRAADKATYEDLVAVVPRDTITFLVEHDFGASWFDSQVEPLYKYRHTRRDVEHYFHDSGIEESRRAFHAAVTEFTLQLSQYSGPSDHGAHFELNEKQWTRSHPSGDETSRRYEAHRRELSGLADKVVASYNALVEEARRQVP